ARTRTIGREHSQTNRGRRRARRRLPRRAWSHAGHHRRTLDGRGDRPAVRAVLWGARGWPRLDRHRRATPSAAAAARPARDLAPGGCESLMSLAVGARAPAELRAALHRSTAENPPGVVLGDLQACDVFDVMSGISTVQARATMSRWKRHGRRRRPFAS